MKSLHWFPVRFRIMFNINVLSYICTLSGELPYAYFRYSAQRLWNSLPVHVRTAKGMGSFQSNLKGYYWLTKISLHLTWHILILISTNLSEFWTVVFVLMAIWCKLRRIPCEIRRCKRSRLSRPEMLSDNRMILSSHQLDFWTSRHPQPAQGLISKCHVVYMVWYFTNHYKQEWILQCIEWKHSKCEMVTRSNYLRLDDIAKQE